MKKENTKEISLQKTDLNRFDVIFEKVEPTPTIDNMSQMQKIFKMNEDAGIKVQSVCFPSNHDFFVEKKESEVLDWFQNTIHSQYSAFSKINSKYKEDSCQISWSNNKIQNKRYLETFQKI